MRLDGGGVLLGAGQLLLEIVDPVVPLLCLPVGAVTLVLVPAGGLDPVDQVPGGLLLDGGVLVDDDGAGPLRFQFPHDAVRVGALGVEVGPLGVEGVDVEGELHEVQEVGLLVPGGLRREVPGVGGDHAVELVEHLLRGGVLRPVLGGHGQGGPGVAVGLGLERAGDDEVLGLRDDPRGGGPVVDGLRGGALVDPGEHGLEGVQDR